MKKHASQSQREVLVSSASGERNPFFVLTPPEMEALGAEGRHRSFKKGEFLFRSGELVEGIFCISSGVVGISQIDAAREIVVRLAGPGEWVGHRSIFTSESYRGSARARDSVKSFFVPTETIQRLFGANKEFAYQLIRLIGRDLENTERLLFEQRKLNVPSRLISLFRVLDQKFGEDESTGRLLAARVSKVEIAQMVGASQEVVSRQFSKWKKEDLLREEGKRIFLSRRLLSRVTRTSRS